MQYCPRCRSEYREGFSRCADCNVDLVAQLPPLPSWKMLFSGNFVQADVLRGALESAGIETIAPDDQVLNLGWEAPTAFPFIRVLVKESDWDKAQEILSGMHPVEDEPPGDGGTRPDQPR